jgi:hypothetical protein
MDLFRLEIGMMPTSPVGNTNTGESSIESEEDLKKSN